jgi:hypothetical protein
MTEAQGLSAAAYSKYEQAWIFEATQEFPLVWKSVIQEHSNTSQPNIGGDQMQLSQKECKDSHLLA